MAVEDGRVNPDNEDIFEEVEAEFVDEDSDEPGFAHVPSHLTGLYEAVMVNDQDHFCDMDVLKISDYCDGNLNDPAEDGDTILHLACLHGQTFSVQALLDRGANIEVRDEDGGIPLHDASAGGYTEIVQQLLNHPSDAAVVRRMLETVDDEGDTTGK
ncbi:hypothetical protein M569_11223 [Genlisea aurea]|uniref:Uncharacterized protein n=1 Tax=Genlisea aurea TaxID=192259 RepID=S8CG75_9LAMI|nr:hypothetical protein M569_11223 [Genlisea aurea]